MKDIIIFFKGHLILNYCVAPYPYIYDPTIILILRDIYVEKINSKFDKFNVKPVLMKSKVFVAF